MGYRGDCPSLILLMKYGPRNSPEIELKGISSYFPPSALFYRVAVTKLLEFLISNVVKISLLPRQERS